MGENALLLLCLPLPLFGIAASPRRAVFLLREWRPAGAIVYRHDFEDASGSWRRLFDEDGSATVSELVRFADETGAYHEAELQRTVSRFLGPDAAHMVWYDPADPSRVTDIGPRHWILAALLLAFAAAALAEPALLLGR